MSRINKLYEYCKENNYFYDAIDNFISIKHNDRRLRYEIKYDLFINFEHSCGYLYNL